MEQAAICLGEKKAFGDIWSWATWFAYSGCRMMGMAAAWRLGWLSRHFPCQPLAISSPVNSVRSQSQTGIIKVNRFILAPFLSNNFTVGYTHLTPLYLLYISERFLRLPTFIDSRVESWTREVMWIYIYINKRRQASKISE